MERIVVIIIFLKLWMSLSYLFQVIELKMIRVRICVGCKVFFMDEEFFNGIVFKYFEKDFIVGINRSKIMLIVLL